MLVSEIVLVRHILGGLFVVVSRIVVLDAWRRRCLCLMVLACGFSHQRAVLPLAGSYRHVLRCPFHLCVAFAMWHYGSSSSCWHFCLYAALSLRCTSRAEGQWDKGA